MVNVLDVEQLYGGYSPKRSTIQNINLHIKAGEMIGLIGVNGAGKSTTIKHILGLMSPHQGKIMINGKTAAEDVEAYRSSYTYVPESPILFEELTVDEHLKLTAMAYGLTEAEYKQRADLLVERFHMDKKRNVIAAHLSKGMRQKVMIMSALLAKPALFIIDEPFLGLDPLGIRSLLQDLVEIKNAGCAILMSSHILSTIEQYCDRFIMLDQGNILAQGTLEQMLQAASQKHGNQVQHLEDAFYELIHGGESL